jgi:D-citramalate synthase
MALMSLHKVQLPINTQLFYSTSRLVSKLTRFPVQPNKAIVGENAFTHEAGIHTHAILASPSTYEPIAPEQVGVTRRFTAGKLSGIHGIQAFMEAMELNPTKEQLQEVFNRVKALGDKGKTVSDVDLYTIAEAVMGLPHVRPLTLEEVTVMTGNKITPTAAVRINLEGNVLTEAAVGIGPVDAAINAINKAVGKATDITLDEYQVKAITGGTDAVVEVSVRIKKDDKRVSSVGAHGDIVMASVEAMLNGMNVLMARTNNNTPKENRSTNKTRKERVENESD